MSRMPDFKDMSVNTVLVTEAPAGADLAGACRWEDPKATGEPAFVETAAEKM